MVQGLEDEEITEIASRMEDYHHEGGKILYSEGDRGTVFYIILQGSVRVWTVEEDDEEREVMALETGDKFGIGALLDDAPRSHSVSTLEDTDFLVMHQEDFEWMLDRFPDIEDYLVELLETREQIEEMYFPWLHPGEVIHILTRRHPATLWVDLLKPFAALLVSGFFFFVSTLTRLETVPIILAFTVLIFSILWAIWEFLDWRNDYFILTDQRVVWIEQIIFQAAARQEAPLAAVQSVDVQTSQIGRILDYGNVLVRTFTGTGSLKLTNVNKPKLMKGTIEELLMRVRKKTQVTAEKQLRHSIRQSLGIEATPVEDTIFYVEKPEPEPKKLALFRTREVSADGRTITYHRHWWVLLMKTWLPLLSLIAMVAVLIYGWINEYQILTFSIPALSFHVFWLIGFLIFIGILAYHYVDWKNDIYKINEDDMIIDSEKKPFGEEISRSAPIKNIISLTHERKGILRLLLNFGMVRVVVADETLPFYDVHNPAQVQQDIYYRQEQIKIQSEEQEYEKDREHIAKWLRAYHDVWQEEDIEAKRRYIADDLDDEEY